MNNLITNRVKFLGACCSYGQRRYGPRVAPYYIEDKIKVDMHKVREHPYKSIFDYDLLYNTHQDMLKDNNNVITIGGDHSISYSTVNSALKKYGDSLHVIWIDAHADLNTQSTSKTHNLHGMPVGHLMGFEEHPVATITNNFLKPSQLTYIGIRDIDPPERERIKRSHIRSYNSFYYSYSIRIADYLKEILKDKKIYFSIDVDSLDPITFPCTGIKIPDGMYIHEVLAIINALKENAVGMDLVEFDPLVDKGFNHMCLAHIESIIKNYSC
jgi:arginase